jgi:hypothetical protein
VPRYSCRYSWRPLVVEALGFSDSELLYVLQTSVVSYFCCFLLLRFGSPHQVAGLIIVGRTTITTGAWMCAKFCGQPADQATPTQIETFATIERETTGLFRSHPLPSGFQRRKFTLYSRSSSVKPPSAHGNHGAAGRGHLAVHSG